MDEQQTSSSVNWERLEQIGVPDSNGVFACRIIDWIRIRRSLRQVTTPIPWLKIFYSLFLGVSISTGLSLMIIPVTEVLSVYVIPLYQCVTVGSFLLSIVLILLDWQIKSTQRSDVNRICADMKDIEKTIPQLRDLPELKD